MAYLQALKVFGDVEATYLGGWQGEILAFIESDKWPSEYGYYRGYYGSCTHCDMWQSAQQSGHDAVLDAFVATAGRIVWFDTYADLVDYAIESIDEEDYNAKEVIAGLRKLIAKTKGWAE